MLGEIADMRGELSGSAVFACPMLSGTGIKNKLLEAMACAAGCVATPLALQGLRVTPGQELLVGTTAEELAHALLRVLEDDECRASLGRAAREYVRSEHDWRSVARAYRDVYRELQPRDAGAAI